jgi:hypothetical protein
VNVAIESSYHVDFSETIYNTVLLEIGKNNRLPST